MAQAGISADNYGYVEYIISHESGWCPTKWNNQIGYCPSGVTEKPIYSSGAYGLGQALGPSKMAPYGDDYMTNPITQLRWANDYAVSRYGSWYQAVLFWKSHSWW